MKKRFIQLAVVTTLMCGLTACGESKNKRGTDEIRVETSGDSQGQTADSEDKTTEAANDGESIWQDPAVGDKIAEINLYIDAYYYNDIDRERQEEALYDGIMSGLDDPYAGYYTQEEFEELQEESSGEYVGIGAVLTQDVDKVITVVRPIAKSPAFEAGLLADDIICEVDGKDVSGEELELVVKWIRGEEGTVAHLKVYRPSIEDYMEFDIRRRVVENLTVSSEMLDNQIAYVKVEQFNENTDEEFAEQLDALRVKGAKGVIIDLRDNPGGLVTSVVNMCNYIMDDGVIVSTKDRDDNQIQCYQADDKLSMDLPTVVLVNGNSASASEIFSGAMQDTGKAEIVGVQTYGKGIVQSVIPLSDGSAIKLTIAKYFTPNGTDIHTKGITPDYVVELPDGQTNAVSIDREVDTQFQKAVEVMNEMM
ncbi:MAG: S41 family peptidase [Eubacteriales bacterium]|nr:S41 family peptidase [Lachnospiraceae bacterium]MDO5128141.1 S41 family peptidase [Eubacteriales bacterium]